MKAPGAVDEVCRTALGSAAGELLFRSTAVGDVVGVRLHDGRQVVVKIHQPRQDPETLAAILDVQAHHHRAGFPRPKRSEVRSRSATDTRRSSRWLSTVIWPTPMNLLGGGSSPKPASGTSMSPGGCGHPPALRRGRNAYPTDRLWPLAAHDPRVDLARTAGGAEWINAFAASVRPTATHKAPLVLGHVDWSGKHFRPAEDRRTVAYDWDSVRVATEAVVVGNAAFSFTANWELTGVDPAPEPDEVHAFIDEYCDARGPGLTREEREQTIACGAYLMAYVARCEHATGDADGGYTRALRQHGARYLHA